MLCRKIWHGFLMNISRSGELFFSFFYHRNQFSHKRIIIRTLTSTVTPTDGHMKISFTYTYNIYDLLKVEFIRTCQCRFFGDCMRIKEKRFTDMLMRAHKNSIIFRKTHVWKTHVKNNFASIPNRQIFLWKELMFP